MSRFKIVLNKPLIPGNTGSIGRTCVALDAELILIKPYGFDLSEKELRRAGLDYWKFVQLKEFDNWDSFISNEKPENIFFFSKLATKNLYEARFLKNCYLVFGSETTGLPNSLYNDFPDSFYKLPMYSEIIRSLNLSNAATAVAYEVLRQIEFQNQ
jgi:tRNA (cytidine/uridine-2'-O-)-methyltransferase